MTNQEKPNSEESTESKTTEVSTTKNEEATESTESVETTQSTAKDEQDSSVSHFEDQKKALQGQVSAKDKQIAEEKQKQKDLEARLNRLENQTQVSELLLDCEAPEAIKRSLKGDLQNLTPDTFEQELNKRLELYNAGAETQKKSITDFVNTRTEKVVPKDFDEKLNEIDPNDPDANEKIKKLSKLL